MAPYNEGVDPEPEDITNLTMDELIAESSFGSPEAVARRAACPREVVDELLPKILAQLDEEKPDG